MIFELGKEQFGIGISDVDGIIKMQEITKIPYSPAYMEGIINLRGDVVPVIDLHKRFGLDPHENTRETRIITVTLGSIKMGMIVSSVTEVLTIDDSVISQPPTMIAGISADFITGVAMIDTRLVILLDLERILTADEVNAASKAIAKK